MKLFSPSLPCSVQSQPCLSLDQLATHSGWVDSNTTLIFLPGIHRLESNSKVFVFNIHFLQLTSDSSFTESQSSIACERDTSVTIHDVSHVSLSRLNFLGCEFIVFSVEQLLIDSSTFQGESDSKTALLVVDTNVNLINTSFLFNRVGTCAQTHNSFTLAGGAIYALTVEYYEYKNNITIAGSRFESNGAEMGGAIYALGYRVKIFNTSFIDNHASAANASFKEMHCDKHVFTTQDTIILVTNLKSNAPDIFSDGYGGAMTLENSDLEIDSCIFVNSTSNGGGGALMVGKGFIVHVNNSHFYNCYANNIGGVLLALLNSFVIVDNCTIYNSSAEYGGLAVMWESNLTIKNSFLSNNTAILYGGVVEMTKGGILKLSSSRFIANKAA